jgi:hypothetical protein
MFHLSRRSKPLVNLSHHDLAGFFFAGIVPVPSSKIIPYHSPTNTPITRNEIEMNLSVAMAHAVVARKRGGEEEQWDRSLTI